MKVVHNKKDDGNLVELRQAAQQYEQDGKLEDAVTAYLAMLKKTPQDQKGYSRLMILYRKLKQPKKEIDIINKGIAAFSKSYTEKQKSSPRKVSQLSTALMKATGLSDKKGKRLYAPEPIPTWERRKALLEKKLSR
jgi:tetratricopeptide (TPR) repeat protein